MDKLGFMGNIRGNVAITFALALLPLAAGVGAAVDLMHQNEVNTLLQAATDSAALAGAASHSNIAAQVSKTAKNYLQANGGLTVMKTLSNLDIQTDTVNGVVSVRLQGKIATSFMAIMGVTQLDVGAFSKAKSASQGTEIALVLDNTGSMGTEGRITALQTAAKGLVKTVLGNVVPGTYVKIGIVPFANYVNVGLANRSASWISVPPDSTATVNACYTSYPQAVASNCHDVTYTGYVDGVPQTFTSQQCDWTYGNPVTTCGPQTIQHTWNGCVGSRNSPLDEGTSQPLLAYPGIMDEWCTAPYTDLTDQISTLNTAIDALVPTGNTYIPSGLLWGWNMLTSDAPLTSAKTKTQMAALHGTKYLVLMTDGDNTLSPDANPNYASHTGSDITLANAKTAALCSNMKKDGIVVFTVAFKVTNATSKSLLQDCASSPGQAFDAADDASLLAAFDTIAVQMAGLRLTQ